MPTAEEELANLSLDRSRPKQTYRFWETQPVAQFQSTSDEQKEGPIDATKTSSEVRQEPYPLIDQFEWCLCDLQDESVITEVYDLLRLNYVEDDDEMFRFCYSREFLRWALCPPGHKTDWHLGVRVKANQKLVSFISGIPVDIHVNGESIPSVEINFLCIHKKLRSKRLAPLLIKEVTRRVNLSARNTMARLVKLNRLPEKPQTPGFREIQAADFGRVTEILNSYLQGYKLRQQFTEAEVRHFLTPQKDLVYVYVVEGEDRSITDVCSFYCLPSSILHHPQHKELKAAYMYYTASTKTPMKQLLNDAMIKARDHDFDVYNALDILENSKELLTDLKFGIGDGNLHYYLFNWRVNAPLQPSDIGLICV